MPPTSTRISQLIRAPRAAVYRALIDARAIAQWRVPEGMTCRVHTFDPREGGTFRISLTYDAPDARGKSSAHTDTYHGYFEKLEPDVQVVEKMEFETDTPEMQGEMTIIYTLIDVPGGTELHAVHAPVPEGVAPADNETGWRMALEKLAQLVESGVIDP